MGQSASHVGRRHGSQGACTGERTPPPFQVGCDKKHLTLRCWIRPSAPKQTEIHKAYGYRVSTQIQLALQSLRTASDFNFLLSVRIYSNAKERKNIITVKGLTCFAKTSEWNPHYRWFRALFLFAPRASGHFFTPFLLFKNKKQTAQCPSLT